MAKVLMICGRLCSGKTTYARALCRSGRAVLLSVDEVMLALFGQHAGEMHDEYARRTRKLLMDKAVELTGAGADVILDWGFWTRADREEARHFFASAGVACELHCLALSKAEWLCRIERRNAEVRAGRTQAYLVDEGLLRKFGSRYEPPAPEEADRWICETETGCSRPDCCMEERKDGIGQ